MRIGERVGGLCAAYPARVIALMSLLACCDWVAVPECLPHSGQLNEDQSTSPLTKHYSSKPTSQSTRKTSSNDALHYNKQFANPFGPHHLLVTPLERPPAATSQHANAAACLVRRCHGENVLVLG